MTTASEKRLASARRMAELFKARTAVRAILLVGSVAEGVADDISDVDTILNYDAKVPSLEELDAIRQSVNGSERVLFIGKPEDGECVESYYIDGIRHDFGHATIQIWERDIEKTMGPEGADSPLQKALSGTLDAIPLHGPELIQRWKDRIAKYPESLAEAVVRNHLKFYAPWIARDMALGRGDVMFLHEILLGGAKNVLGILVGLNRVYHWGEYKRLDSFVKKLPISPSDLAARINCMLTAEAGSAIEEYISLVRETLTLAERHMPTVGAAAALQRFERPYGK